MFTSLEEKATAEALDSKARRSAARVSLKCKKSRWRPGSPDNAGHYQLVDLITGCVVSGFRYELSPEAVIEHCASIEREWLASEMAAAKQEMKDVAAAAAIERNDYGRY